MIPESLKLHNFLSHADTELPLMDIGMAAICGPNGNGKSSLIDAITYALFGKGRGDSLDDLVRLGEQSMRVEFTFLLGGQPYRINRSRELKSGGKSLLGFDLWDGKAWKNLAGASIAETQAKIESVLHMDYNTLVNSSILLQGNSDEFSRQQPAKRKEVLSKILGLEVYDLVAAHVREKGREAKAQIDASRNQIAAKEQELTSREAIESGLKSHREEIAQHTAGIKALELELSSLQEQKETLVVSSARYQDITRQQVEIQQEITSISAELQSLELQVSERKSRIAGEDEIKRKAGRHAEAVKELEVVDDIGRRVSILSAEKSDAERQGRDLQGSRDRAVEQTRRALTEDESALKQERTQLLATLEGLKPQAEGLHGLPCAENAAMQNECRLLSGARDARDRMPLIEERLAEIETEIKALPESAKGKAYQEALIEQDAPNCYFQAAEDKADKIRQINFNPERQAQLRQEVNELAPYADALSGLQVTKAELSGLMQTIEDRKVRISSLNTKQGELQTEAVVLSPSNQQLTAITQDIANKTSVLESLRSALSTAEKAASSLDAQLKRLDRVAEELKEIASGVAEQEERIKLLADLATMFGKNGIQAMLIERAMPAIEDEANALLSRLTDGLTVTIETQRETKSSALQETLDIILTDDMGRRAYESFSGGEKFRVDFALRIALSKLLAHRAGARLETLVLDEGWGSLDKEGIASLLECLNVITSDFKCILVITHIDEVVEAFPTRIQVSKGESGSLAEIVQ